MICTTLLHDEHIITPRETQSQTQVNVNQLKKLALVLGKLQAAGNAIFPPESFPISNYGSGQSQLYAWQR